MSFTRENKNLKLLEGNVGTVSKKNFFILQFLTFRIASVWTKYVLFMALYIIMSQIPYALKFRHFYITKTKKKQENLVTIRIFAIRSLQL